jgi:spermidine synthase
VLYDRALGLYIPAFLLQLALSDRARWLAGVPAYATFPLARLLPVALLVNAPVGGVTGWLFTLAAEWMAAAVPVSRVYLLDALGCAVGGTGATLLLSAGWSEERVFLFAVALLGLAAAFGAPARRRAMPAVMAGLAAVLLAGGVDARWTQARDRAVWTRRGWAVETETVFATPQTRYRIGRRAGEVLILAGESLVETLPSDERARATVALHLAQHPRARRALVIGPGAYALCRALRQMPGIEQVCWLHPDPDYPARLVRRLPPELSPLPGLEIPGEDPRSFLRRRGELFDLVILDMPDPTTLTLNRYSTVEFLSTLRQRLAPDGVLGVRFGGAENVISEDQARLGAIWRVTLSRCFNRLALMPGEESRWFATVAGDVSEDGDELRRRWQALPGAEDFYPADALATWFPANRIRFQKDAYTAVERKFGTAALVNSDLRPRALGAALARATLEAGGAGARWLGDIFRADAAALMRAALAAALAAAALRGFYRRGAAERGGGGGVPRDPAARLTVTVGAAASMGYEIALMYLFQSRYGTVYLHAGLLSSLSMFGLWAGNLAARRWVRNGEPRGLLPLEAIVCAAMAAVCAVGAERIGRAGIALALALGGFLGGGWVPVAAARLDRNGWPPGRAAAQIEAADAFGGVIGGWVVGLWLLPVAGVSACLVALAALWGVNLFAAPPRGGETAPPLADRWDKAMRWLGYLGLWIFATCAATRMPWRAAAPAPVPEVECLKQLASEWSPGVPVTPATWRLANGKEIPVLQVGVDGCEGVVLTTESLDLSARGFGGPLVLGLWVAPGGEVRALRVLRHNETPFYYGRTLDWQRGLVGRNVFETETLAACDVATGATLTSRAILDMLTEIGVALRTLPDSTPCGPPALARRWRVEASGVALAAFAAAAIWLRRRPSRRVRRLFLAAVVLGLGVVWNAQFSTAQLQSWLIGRLPPPGVTAVAMLAFGVPLLVFFVGNIYCGWLCPFGALQELVGEGWPARRRLDPDKNAWRFGKALKYTVVFGVALTLTVHPHAEPERWDPLVTVFFRGHRGAPMRWAAIGFLVLAVGYRRYWCRQWCPAGALLSWIGGGLGLFRRWRPTVRPAGCDLGVRRRNELDCLACDRCRLPVVADGGRNDARSTTGRRVAYAAAILAGAAIWSAAIARSSATISGAGGAAPPGEEAGISASTAARVGRPAPEERIREMQRRGRLSTEEARHYERLDD